MTAFVMSVHSRTPLATVVSCAHGNGWQGDPDEEAWARPVVVFTTRGRWRITGRRRVDADQGVVVLGHAGESYRCAHYEQRPTDCTTYVAFDHERLGYDPLPPASAFERSARLDGLLAGLMHATEPLHVDALALRLVLELRDEPPSTRRRHSAVSAARTYLDERYAQDVSLDEVARSVHVSPFHLHRLFRDEVGVPPHEYVTRLRIRRACELLASGASVTETATAVGFGSPGHFATVFRRRLGVSPSSYRRSSATA